MATLRPLTPELQKVACDELHEVESRIPEDLAALRAWIAKQPHLRACTDDQVLIAFLRGCKHSMEKVKSKIDYFYTIKTILPDIFGNRRIDDRFLELCRLGFYFGLPKPIGPAGPRIHFTIYKNFDMNKYTLYDLFRYEIYFEEYHILQDDNCIISGYMELVDMEGVGLNFIKQMDFMLIKKLATFAEKASPMRLKGVHLINCPKEAMAVLNLIRSFLSTKLQKRFYVHKNLDELYKHIPKEYLPEEYGGTNGNVPGIVAETEKEFKAISDFYVKADEYGVDEKLRPGKHVDQNSLFGIDGSFRKLDID